MQEILRVALAERRDPEFLLAVLNGVSVPATAQYRLNGPFLEEGFAVSLLAEAARLGHVALALRSWEFLEYSLLPLQLPGAPPTGGGEAQIPRAVCLHCVTPLL